MKLLTKERGLAYVQLARIDKPIGTLLLLWPTLWRSVSRRADCRIPGS